MSDEDCYVPPKVWVWESENGGRFSNINRPVAGATHHEVTGNFGVAGSSIQFDGTTDYITHEVHPDFNLLSDTFTIMCDDSDFSLFFI